VTPLLLATEAAPASAPLSRVRRFLLQWGIWSAIAVFFASQAVAMVMAMVPRTSLNLYVVWQRQLLFNFVCYYLWWALTPLILKLDRRWRLEGAGWARGAWAHGIASIVLGTAHLPVSQLIFKLIYNPLAGWERFMPGLWPLFRDNIHLNILSYWAIIGVYYVLDYHHRWREREVRAAELERALSEAQLQALKMQLHPHFLFNALNSIAALMHTDVDAADTMLVRLSDLLRRALDQAGAQEVTLGQELDFLRPYLEIEKIRFQERLSVEFAVPAELLNVRVPNLILQPLVENAIRHGIAARTAAGRIAVSATRTGDTLNLEVRDNGRGLRGAEAPVDGIGLSNTRARLERLYGAAQSFGLVNLPEGGLAARISLPLRLAPAG